MNKQIIKPSLAALLSGLALVAPFASGAEKVRPEDKAGYDQTKDVGAELPEGAELLFDGTMESLTKNWEMWPDASMDLTWEIVDSPTGDEKVLMTNGGQKWGTHDIVTKKKYRDYHGHAEFVLMGARGDGKAEGYANSGVYMQNRFELQIESPRGEENIKNPYAWKIGTHGIGAICNERVPDENAWRPNGEWQAFHFNFRAARYDGDQVTEPARLTLWWNGVKVHDNAVASKANGGVKPGPSPEGLKLQEHGQDVRFRNVWIKELDAQ